MRLITSRTHLACALLFISCALSACGGSSGGFTGLPVAGTPDTTPPPPDTGVKPEKRCAP